jgi:FkbM family methyltransferase
MAIRSPIDRKTDPIVRSLLKTIFRGLVPTRVQEGLARVALDSMPADALDRLRQRYDMVSVPMSFRQLRQLGFAPKAIIDVGAFRGEWTRLIEEIYPAASILMIEPQAESAAILGDMARASAGRVQYRRALLGAAPRSDVVFYEMREGSSIFPEQSPFARTEVRHDMTTLDAVVREAAFPAAALLKLDAQGAELDILRGGAATLAAAEVVLMEVPLIGVNRGAPLLDAVVPFMKEHGFVAHDICSFSRRTLDGALWTVDILFAAERSTLRASERYR